MLFLQIKQAEVALGDGRLDEAYQLIQSDSNLRAHRRGQALITDLVHKLVERSESHLKDSRAMLALADCDKAKTLGGNLDEIASLRTKIEEEIVNTDRAHRQEAHVGKLETAAALVDSALARQDLDRAVLELVRAKGAGTDDHRIRELDATVRESLITQIKDALNAGRSDQAESLLDRLTRLDSQNLGTQELTRAMDQIRAASAAIDQGNLDQASQNLRRAAMQLPDARWIKQALEYLATASEALDAVRIGPLGLLSVDTGKHQRVTGVPPVPAAQHGRDARDTGTVLPNKFVLQVDGAGAFLVLQQSKVTLGPISSSQAPDVGLMAEPGAAVVTVERMEDDYFLRLGPGAPSKLLASGDRLSISPRCRLIFNQPNPSSTTAVLDLATGRFPRADLRRVILLDGELIIGPGPAAHIRADQLSQPLVLHVRDNRLWCKNEQLAIGAPISISGLSIVATMG